MSQARVDTIIFLHLSIDLLLVSVLNHWFFFDKYFSGISFSDSVVARGKNINYGWNYGTQGRGPMFSLSAYDKVIWL